MGSTGASGAVSGVCEIGGRHSVYNCIWIYGEVVCWVLRAGVRVSAATSWHVPSTDRNGNLVHTIPSEHTSTGSRRHDLLQPWKDLEL